MKTNFLKCFALLSFVFISVLAANAQNGDGQTKDTPLKITKKEPPRASVFAQCFKLYGTPYLKVLARVTIDKSGEISDVEIVQESECREFDEESVRVAGKIKFQPATKDGEAITVTKTVIYEGGIR